MTAKTVGLVLLAATASAVALYPTQRGRAATGSVLPPIPAQQQTRPAHHAKVDAVFVLDTTGSMSGLIEAAKQKIWSIASTMAQARPAPEIRIGLVAYRDRGDDYVTRVVDLSPDLDSMYAQLMSFTAGGGGDTPESVNRALDDAVNRISWSADSSSYKVVFLVGDAPPHMDYQDDRKYPDSLREAAAKGIVVNTIQCGDMAATMAPWQQIASLGGGRYFRVEQSGSAVVIGTPYDAELADLSAQLDATRLYYGAPAVRRALESKAEATAALRAAATTAAQARRGVFNSSAAGSANLTAGHDLVANVASGRADIAAVPPSELPKALAALPADKRRQHVEEAAARRKEIQRQIAELGKKRDAYIAKKLDERGGAAGSLDQKIYEAVKDQAASKGLVYSGGPKF